MTSKSLTNLILTTLLTRYALAFSLFDPYDDKLSFSISWVHPNDVSNLASFQSPQYKRLELRTSRNEPYTCYIPLSLPSQGIDEFEQSRQENIYFTDVLEPFFQSERCHYSVEGYWTYEICHGKKLRQYHKEEAKGKKVSLITLEYALGYFDIPMTHFNSLPLSSTPYSGSKLPYYGVELKKGSACTILGGKNREAIIKYICNPYGDHNEFLHIEEISTCRYSVVFGTAYLCRFDAFKVESLQTERIQCVAGEDGTDSGEPTDLLALNREIDMLEHPPRRPARNGDAPTLEQTHSLSSDSVVHRFLTREVCLQGGSSGWWQYEFCYGEYVRQVHVDAAGSQEILVGSWNKKAHIDWFEANKSTMKLVTDSMVLHYYTGGDTCDDTAKERSVIVRMKCVRVGNLEQVSLYLEEPRMCEYELTVESEIFCQLMESVGEYGLYQTEKREKQE